MSTPAHGQRLESCASDRFPREAIDAMVRESGRPRHDDGHTDCYYAGLLIAALPHLLTDDMVERTARAIAMYIDENDHEWTAHKPIARKALAAALVEPHPTAALDPGPVRRVMTTVYVVHDEIGEEVATVFSSLEKAQEWLDERPLLEPGGVTGDTGYAIEKWTVDDPALTR